MTYDEVNIHQPELPVLFCDTVTCRCDVYVTHKPESVYAFGKVATNTTLLKVFCTMHLLMKHLQYKEQAWLSTLTRRRCYDNKI